MNPSIQFSENTGGLGAAVGGFLKKQAPILGGAVGKLKRKQAATTLLLIAYNNMVKSLRNYKAQEIEGGLGKGGKLRIGS